MWRSPSWYVFDYPSVQGLCSPQGSCTSDPLVNLRKDTTEATVEDKWTKTYASTNTSKSSSRPTSSYLLNKDVDVSERPKPAASNNRFPRPTSSSSKKDVSVGNGVRDYIASATSRTIAPLKYTMTGPNPEAGILPSLAPNDTTLSKVYGSVLQPKETLDSFACAICSTKFPPDATIYPDPLQPESSHRFLCRPCFVDNGGSKGPCGTCSRPVLTLKSDGGFIHAADKFWHKRCFNCAGCDKNIGDKPMVDLLGHPCCPDCFDTCLTRNSTPKKKATTDSSEPINKLGRLSISTPTPKSRRGSREASPVIGELEQLLGLKRRESSPELQDLSQRLSAIGNDRYIDSPSTSPLRRSFNGRRDEITGIPLRKSVSSQGDDVSTSPVRKSIGSRSEDASTSPLRKSVSSRGEDNAGTQLRKSTSDRGELGSSSPLRRSLAGREDSSRSPFRKSINGHIPYDEGRYSPTRPSPSRSQKSENPVPTPEAVEEVRQRLLDAVVSTTLKPRTSPFPPSRTQAPSTRGRITSSQSSSVISDTSDSPSIPPIPDLISDFSDTLTQSSLSFDDFDSSPPLPPNDDLFAPSKGSTNTYGSRYKRSDYYNTFDETIVEETTSQLNTPTKTPTRTANKYETPSKTKTTLPTPSPLRHKTSSDSLQQSTSQSGETIPTTCGKCNGKLFSMGNKGSFVTVPSDDGGAARRYHPQCFTCHICHTPFEKGSNGQATFVKYEGDACHPEVSGHH